MSYAIADAMNTVDERVRTAAKEIHPDAPILAMDDDSVGLALVGTEIDGPELISVLDQMSTKSRAMIVVGMPVETIVVATFFEAFLGGYLYCEKRMKELEAELKEATSKLDDSIS